MAVAAEKARKPAAKKKSRAKTPESEVLADVGALREKLIRRHPGLADAAEFERQVENFCRSVRAQLAKERNRQKIGQTEAGARMDLGQSAVSKIERGEGDIGLKTIYRYAEALGMRPVVSFVPSAQTIVEKSEVVGQSAPVSESVAAAFEDVQEELIRRLADGLAEVLPTLGR